MTDSVASVMSGTSVIVGRAPGPSSTPSPSLGLPFGSQFLGLPHAFDSAPVHL